MYELHVQETEFVVCIYKHIQIGIRRGRSLRMKVTNKLKEHIEK